MGAEWTRVLGTYLRVHASRTWSLRYVASRTSDSGQGTSGRANDHGHKWSKDSSWRRAPVRILRRMRRAAVGHTSAPRNNGQSRRATQRASHVPAPAVSYLARAAPSSNTSISRRRRALQATSPWLGVIHGEHDRRGRCTEDLPCVHGQAGVRAMLRRKQQSLRAPDVPSSNDLAGTNSR